jgi:hypothetical protein
MKNLLNKKGLGLFTLMLAFLAIAGMTPVNAAYGTNITDIVSDATSLFTSVQTLVVTILAFGIGVWVIQKLRRR